MPPAMRRSPEGIRVSEDKPTILIVDDTPDNLALLSALLRDKYRVKVATGGEKALQIVAAGPLPDLILLDVMMPGLNGYETCQRLKSDPASAAIPVLFLTARVRPEDEEMGLKLGAADYITKPIGPAIVQARVATQLQLRRARALLAEQERQQAQAGTERTRELLQVQEAMILAMATMAEMHNAATANHIRRTQAYVATLARALRAHPRFTAVLSEEDIELLTRAVPLHDIGTVGVPHSILDKPGRLSEEEWEAVKQHPARGRDTILAMEKHLAGSDRFLSFAREIAYSHQEKWDGSGYPQGLRGEQIPLSARLMAVADVYDALVSRRAYKTPCTHEAAVEQMVAGRASHFDPDVLDAFLQVQPSFREIALQFPDCEDAT